MVVRAPPEQSCVLSAQLTQIYFNFMTRGAGEQPRTATGEETEQEQHSSHPALPAPQLWLQHGVMLAAGAAALLC